MKVADILQEQREWHDPETEYRVSSFTYDDVPEHGAGENTPEDNEKDDKQNSQSKDSRSRTFIPSSVNIDENDTIDLVKDNQVIKTATWKRMKRWLKRNWDNLNGTFMLSSGDQVLHSFRISSSQGTEEAEE